MQPLEEPLHLKAVYGRRKCTGKDLLVCAAYQDVIGPWQLADDSAHPGADAGRLPSTTPRLNHQLLAHIRCQLHGQLEWIVADGAEVIQHLLIQALPVARASVMEFLNLLLDQADLRCLCTRQVLLAVRHAT